MEATYYFHDCDNLATARARFRDLAKTLHPDMGGAAEQFRAMVAQFQELQANDWRTTGKAKFGADYESGKSFDLSPDMLARVMMAAGLSGCTVEIMGTWAWITGDTKAHREALKAQGFRWAPRKQAWCYHEDPYRRKHGREYSLDEIRNMHGAADVRRNATQGAQLSA